MKNIEKVCLQLQFDTHFTYVPVPEFTSSYFCVNFYLNSFLKIQGKKAASVQPAASGAAADSSDDEGPTR